jgi:hypothetical protein
MKMRNVILLITSLSLVLLFGYGVLGLFNNHKIGMSLKKERQYKETIDSLKLELDSRDDEIEELFDEIQMKEAEISYWGQKYDSIKTKNHPY